MIRLIKVGKPVESCINLSKNIILIEIWSINIYFYISIFEYESAALNITYIFSIIIKHKNIYKH